MCVCVCVYCVVVVVVVVMMVGVVVSCSYFPARPILYTEQDRAESSRITRLQPIFLWYAGCPVPAVLSTGKL